MNWCGSIFKADTVGRSAIHSYADFQRENENDSIHALQHNTKKNPLFFAKRILRYTSLNIEIYLCTY